MIAAAPILRIFSSVLLVLLLAADAHAQTTSRDPRPHADAADVARSPLDLRTVTFGQRGTEIALRLTTASTWEPSQLQGDSGRSLCVRLHYGRLPTPRARVCVGARDDGRPTLTYERLDPFGSPVERRTISATVIRPDKRSIEATFEPTTVNLGQGRYSWQVESRWSCAVPLECRDLSPDRGNVIARIRPLAEPPCFGAAARSPTRGCSVRSLRLAVTPAPADAPLTPNARCLVVSRSVPYTCEFGVRKAVSTRTIALVGDSHAGHWRGALEVVAQARRWRGYSLTRSGCPLTTATPDFAPARTRSCQAWRGAVMQWFAQHPEVRTVFVSQLATIGVRPPRGVDADDYQVRGYLRAWSMLPPTVRQIVVLRDTPVSAVSAPLCIERAVRARRAPQFACAITRTRAVRRDPAAIASRRTRSKRVHLVDLTRFMCSPRLCYPVVGGVLVHKDTDHITPLFAGTLGPFLLRRVDQLLG